MNEFDNKMVETRFGKIEVSRIIASWHNLGGRTGTNYRRLRYFDEWMHRCGISEEDRRFIRNFAGNGKLELEESAEKFMKELNKIEF